MNITRLPLAAALILSAFSAPVLAADAHPSKALEAAVAAPTRSAANKARDVYRHPAETLAFFGIKPGDTVVEIWPGGGWYTEILAPYLKDKGQLIVRRPQGQGRRTSPACSTPIRQPMARWPAPTSRRKWAARPLHRAAQMRC